MWKCIGLYTPVILVSDVWSSESFVTKGFFASFLLTGLLLAAILVSLFSFTPLFLQMFLKLSWLVWICVLLCMVNALLNTVYVAVSPGDILVFQPRTFLTKYSGIV